VTGCENSEILPERLKELEYAETTLTVTFSRVKSPKVLEWNLERSIENLIRYIV
jgi:hypothetical protein